MSKPKVFEKPTGVKDYLPETVSKLRRIEARVLECMEKWGYSQIITPTLEFYDTVGTASSTMDKKLFKLLDQNGRTLVLRSELTAPIARVVGSLLKDEPFPLRLSYHSNVFRAFEQEAGRESEFFQTGVELVGDGSPEVDAEVIALAIATLQAAGLQSFKISLGHVGYLNGLFNETLPGRIEEQEELKRCLLKRDHVGYRQQLQKLDLVDETRRELEGILRLRGGEEICEQARSVTEDPLAQQSIQHLCEIWDVLEVYGVSGYVLIDLTMIGDFSYYTGMTFEGYSADLGFPVCSGGRYDNLLAMFGRPAPATGFALKTDRILEAVSKLSVDRLRRVLVAYTANGRKAAFNCAAQLREESGVQVETRRVDGEWNDEARTPDADGLYRYMGKVYDEMNYFG
ncbi:ATP phosphoribosyltransferase regulatory subunit [Paenibacillus sp. J2TS4]|uniref:ATP phosphoribosyltransferase regulatory subunit n=1 Tax=Paenibacillus sp. J2TS4 TaxID=2807194 RepID=UPI001B1EB1BC|nr:ATP phosphoribosyltransferase regulatory subunit [Paenibacillus sp. J2TS4]GIP34281.1 ATP phosphoribosyltransferase regulatory subunit [Paenibacillus sp. J2TS4]